MNQPESASFIPQKTIVLTGTMGAGKSAVGRRLASRVGLPFVDSDSEIEKAAGMSIAQFFDRYGEAEFREGERRIIGRLLDGGAQGIIAPRIDTADQARAVARACRFAPRGQRSQLATVPQFGMRPTPAATMNPALDRATIVQILIETPAGVASADAIAQLDGVDMLAIGANDLTAELGVPGRYDDPRVRDAVATAARACQRHGKLLMVGGIADLAILDDLALLGCLRALSQHAQATGNARIPWGGTKRADWAARNHQATFHFSSIGYRDDFLAQARRLLPESLWSVKAQSDEDLASPQAD